MKMCRSVFGLSSNLCLDQNFVGKIRIFDLTSLFWPNLPNPGTPWPGCGSPGLLQGGVRPFHGLQTILLLVNIILAKKGLLLLIIITLPNPFKRQVRALSMDTGGSMADILENIGASSESLSSLIPHEKREVNRSCEIKSSISLSLGACWFRDVFEADDRRGQDVGGLQTCQRGRQHGGHQHLPKVLRCEDTNPEWLRSKEESVSCKRAGGGERSTEKVGGIICWQKLSAREIQATYIKVVYLRGYILLTGGRSSRRSRRRRRRRWWG